jgi:uncharacterized protein Usg
MRSFVLTPSLSLLRPQELTTAEILYYMPDYPVLLQSFVWQDFDIAPNFPSLRRFVTFWNDNLDGKVHSVRVASKVFEFPFEICAIGSEFSLDGGQPSY